MAYFGFIPLSTNLVASQQTKNASLALKDTDSTAPTYRIYGATGTALTTGTMTFRDTGNITAATNATPIQVTSAAHGLSTGTRVTISGVLGNTAANGDFTITVVDANNFTLASSAGNGAYTSGGTWHVTGLYSCTVLADPNVGYASGQTYTVSVTYTVASVVTGEIHSFTCV